MLLNDAQIRLTRFCCWSIALQRIFVVVVIVVAVVVVTVVAVVAAAVWIMIKK